MNTLKISVFLSVVLLLSAHVDNAYAQFWRRWFQKGRQAEELIVEEKIQPDITQERLPAQRYGELTEYGKETAEGVHVDIRIIDEPEDMPEEVGEDIRESLPAIPGTPAAYSTTEIDEKQRREEELRRTQEQVNQIKQLQEINNIQRSLDNIRRINEINQQRRRIDEINRLNNMQGKQD